MDVDHLVETLQRAHELWPAGAAHRVLSQGEENLTIDVADHFIVRVSVEGTGRADRIAIESALLRALPSRVGVAVPQPLVADQVTGVVIYPKLPGTPYLLEESTPPTALIRGLTDLLQGLRGLDATVDVPVDDSTRQSWLGEAAETAEAIGPHLEGDHRAAVHNFLLQPLPTGSAGFTLCHNDLGAEHLLVDTTSGELSGVIDWTDAARTDPARDYGRLYRDLGPEVAEATAVAVGDATDAELMTRAAFYARCTWIEDYAYARADPIGRSAHLRNCQRTFCHTFADRQPPHH